MFRKLIVIICLVSFTATAVSAQGLSTIATQPDRAVSTVENTSQPLGDVDLSLSAETTKSILMASADQKQGKMLSDSSEKRCEPRSAHTWDNFVDVHFGDYRWVWWAGAAAILIAIHAGAD